MKLNHHLIGKNKKSNGKEFHHLVKLKNNDLNKRKVTLMQQIKHNHMHINYFKIIIKRLLQVKQI